MDFGFFGSGYCVRHWVLRGWIGLEYEVEIRRGRKFDLRKVGVSCEGFCGKRHDE